MAPKPSLTEEQVKSLATNLYKHLDYKTNVVMERVKIGNYVPTTIGQMHSLARSYIYGNKKFSKAPATFYDVLESLKNSHYAKLTPSEENKAKPFATKTRTVKGSKVVTRKQEPQVSNEISTNNSKLNISSQTLESIKKQQEKQQGVQRKTGILVDNVIKLFKNEDQLSGYLMACQDVDNSTNLQVVDVVITPRI